MSRKSTFLLLLMSLIVVSGMRAQVFLDRNFYLVDSIEKSKVSKPDQKLLDSLLPLYHASRHDTVRAKILSDIIENSYDEKIWPRYNLYLKQFVEQRLQDKKLDPEIHLSFERGLASCYNNIGYLQKQQGEIKKALKSYAKAQDILRKINDLAGLATNYNNTGYIYFDQGNIPMAIKYFDQAIKYYKLSEQQGEDADKIQDQVAIVYNNLGLLYSRQTDYQRALNYYEKALDIKIKTNEPWGLSLAYGNIGSIYIKHNKSLCPQPANPNCATQLFEKGMSYLRKSIDYDQKIGYETNIARTYHNIGIGFELAQQLDSAIHYFNLSVSIKRKKKDLNGLCLSLTRLGEISLGRGNRAEAKKSLTEAYNYAQKLGFPENISMSSKALSQLYEKGNNFREALLHYKTYIEMRDSTINEKNTRAAVQRDIEFEYRKKLATDSISNAKKAEIQEARIRAQESELKSERNGKIALYTGVVSLLIIVLLVYYRFRSTQKQKNIIQEQKHLVEEKQREIIDSINYAQRLQNAILAKESEIKKIFPEFFLLYLPKDIVAGDFYFFDVTETHAFYAVADCTGHGVPGAMVSVICSNALSQSINEFRITDTGKILEKAREIILETFKKSGENVKDGMDISLVGVNLKDLDTLKTHPAAGLKVQWTGANNSLYIYSAREQRGFEVKSDKQPVGYTEHPQPFNTHTLCLYKNDYIFMYTDGFHDQFGGPNGKKLKKMNMYNMMDRYGQALPDELGKILKLNFETWKGKHEQLDDVCITGIRI